MSYLSLTLLWCALQTTLLAMLTLILGSRPWRIGGSLAPLLGLVGVLFITGLAFLPIPWSWNFRLELEFSLIRSAKRFQRALFSDSRCRCKYR